MRGCFLSALENLYKSFLMYSFIIICGYVDAMLFVSDSSTLILMAKTSLLDPAIMRFDGITIPLAVEREVVERGVETNREDAFLVRQRIMDKKIKVVEVDSKSASSIVRDFNLHLGEAEAIALYLNLKGDLLGVDDGKAIKICKILNVRFFTCLSLLVWLCQEKTISIEMAKAHIEKLARLSAYKSSELVFALEKIGGVGK